MKFDLLPLLLTLKLAAVTGTVLFAVSLPLVYWLHFTKSPAATAVRALVNIPFVLPPVVVGFYLLLLLSPAAPVGAFLDHAFRLRLVFTFEGLVVGSVLFNLPFMVNPIIAGLEGLPRSLAEASYTVGKGRMTTFLRVLLPSVRSSMVTGIVMTCAHTIGEFGVVLMIGGKIEGVTKVASIAVYDEVESLNFGAAHAYAAILTAISFALLFVLYYLNKRSPRLW